MLTNKDKGWLSEQESFKNNLSLIKEFNSDWIGPGSDKVFSLLKTDTGHYNYKEPYYDSENYYITYSVGDKKVISSDPGFNYKINSHGFRSQHFKTIDNKKITILTAGCSHSFGEGLPDELRWQSFLKNYFYKNEIDLFDVSAMGASSRLIIKNIFSFIRNYGRPDYIFLVLPDLAREFLYSEKGARFINGHANDKFLIDKNAPAELKNFSSSFDEFNYAMYVIEYIWMLEEFCKYANIKFFWSTWSQESAKFFNNINSFKNYLPHDFKIFKEMALDISDNDKINSFIFNNKITENNIISYIKKYWVFANDKSHYGVFWTHEISKMFGEKIINDR